MKLEQDRGALLLLVLGLKLLLFATLAHDSRQFDTLQTLLRFVAIVEFRRDKCHAPGPLTPNDLAKSSINLDRLARAELKRTSCLCDKDT